MDHQPPWADSNSAVIEAQPPSIKGVYVEGNERFDEPQGLYLKVLALLDGKRDKDLQQIWKETGIPYYWLRKLYLGVIKSPGVNRMQYLYEYLTDRKLEV